MFCHLLSYTHLALWRGKRPKVNAKQKGFWNFLSFSLLFFAQYFGVEFKIKHRKNIAKRTLSPDHVKIIERSSALLKVLKIPGPSK